MKQSTIDAIKKLADLDVTTRRLIRMANRDLYEGLGSSEVAAEWPGFSKACEHIRDALPTGDLYLDNDTGSVSDTAPEDTEDCDQCNGSGEVDDDDGSTLTSLHCADCRGTGRVDAYLDNSTTIPSRDVRVALVGAELARYV